MSVGRILKPDRRAATDTVPAKAEAVTPRRTLKRDSLGTVEVRSVGGTAVVVRDTRAAGRWVRFLAARLARREAEALAVLDGLAEIPRLIDCNGRTLRRTWLPGLTMHRGQAPSELYFRRAQKLLFRMHRRGVAHNDLAKEANWICMPGERPAIVDFQLAIVSTRRGRWFRLLAREDLRHLLKHKRRYRPDALTARQRALLARPSLAARLWRLLFKPPYHFVTRRILGWPERDGAEERQLG